MITRRRFFQYAGLGSASFLLAGRDRLFNLPSSDSTLQHSSTLSTFYFDVATVDQAGQLKQSERHSAQFFPEPLSPDHFLEMVSVSEGHFSMGSSRNEVRRVAHESLRHDVDLPSFFVSKYPITQAQWAVIAALPQVNRALNPDPAYFQGDNHPIESVSWLDAVEFCDRLSQHTGRRYQLPTEAQWEYACRAGTTTPFHTGETITSQLADYVGTYTYQSEPTGNYQQQTLPIGSFSPNAFGLYDMHGNVWEWCADAWTPSRPTLSNRLYSQSVNTDSLRAIRGGSWLDAPAKLRSASRSGYSETSLNRTIGFRVVTL